MIGLHLDASHKVVRYRFAEVTICLVAQIFALRPNLLHLESRRQQRFLNPDLNGHSQRQAATVVQGCQHVSRR